MNEALIFDALRTPRGKGRADGALHEVKPVTLLGGLLNALQSRHQLDTAQVDDIVMGCVAPVGDQGGDIAKIAALSSGWDWRASGVQLNRFCASGLEAVNLAAMKIRSGWEDLVVAGGVESMSRVAMGSDGGAMANDPATSLAINYVPQGLAADLIATLEGYGRADVDAYALESQKRATAARDAGLFDRSVVPVVDINGMTILARDEFIRPATTLESLGSLKPAFEAFGKLGFNETAIRQYPQVERIGHVHTAGNSSGIVDGAAVVLIGSERKGRELGLTPRARIVATAVTGSCPTLVIDGPATATCKVLAKAGMSIEQIDLFEVNEAFACVPMRFMRLMNLSHDKVNVNGGAIALGHPLGATGAMLIGTLLDELERRQQRFGLATLCVAGGMGIATIIERL